MKAQSIRQGVEKGDKKGRSLGNEGDFAESLGHYDTYIWHVFVKKSQKQKLKTVRFIRTLFYVLSVNPGFWMCL